MNLAINGFGRIGRQAFKAAFGNKKIEVVGINDLTDTRTLAHLLTHDTAYGKWATPVSFDEKNLIVDGKKIPVFAEKDPALLPWKRLEVDVVLECTGRFTKKEQSCVINNASCTTNCIAPVMAVLDEAFGIEKAFMSTVHGYTADQNLQDGPHKDLRRARAAAENVVPTSTGAAKAVGEAKPNLKGIFDGIAFRVPVPTCSLSDISAVLKKNVTKEEINEALMKAAKTKRFEGILMCTDEPLVSSDYVGNSYSSIVDMPLTNVVGGNLVKVVAWYDNEVGYSHRLVEMAELFA